MTETAHLLTHLYQRTALKNHANRCEVSSCKRAGHETFPQSAASDDHFGLQISGFGARVPGGAHQPGHSVGRGFFIPQLILYAFLGRRQRSPAGELGAWHYSRSS